MYLSKKIKKLDGFQFPRKTETERTYKLFLNIMCTAPIIIPFYDTKFQNIEIIVAFELFGILCFWNNGNLYA